MAVSSCSEWDRVAAAWARWSGHFARWTEPAARRLLEGLEPRQGGRLIDMGAGTAELSIRLRREKAAVDVLAVDLSPVMLGIARTEMGKAGTTAVQLAAMRAENLAIRDASVDAVIAQFCLHLTDTQTALAEIRRVLRPGGMVGVLTWARAEECPFFTLPDQVITRRLGLPPRAPGTGPFHLATPGRLRGLFERAGLSPGAQETIRTPVTLPSAGEALAMLREPFGPRSAELAGVGEQTRREVWDEVGRALERFEGSYGFMSPASAVVAFAVR